MGHTKARRIISWWSDVGWWLQLAECMRMVAWRVRTSLKSGISQSWWRHLQSLRSVLALVDRPIAIEDNIRWPWRWPGTMWLQVHRAIVTTTLWYQNWYSLSFLLFTLQDFVDLDSLLFTYCILSLLACNFIFLSISVLDSAGLWDVWS